MKKGIISVLSAVTGAAIGAGVVRKAEIEEKKKVKSMSDKHLSLFLMMNQWVKVKQEGKNLSAYFEKNNYRKIAVYGMSYAGERLIEELNGTTVEVVYGIDKNADAIYADVDVVTIDGNLGAVDAVVVTAVTLYDEIERELAGKMESPILSLEDILYEI